MSLTDWAALSGVAVTILGGLAHLVWLIASMRTKVDGLCRTMRETGELIRSHAQDCREDRAKLRVMVEQHEVRIARLEDTSGL